eukprot:6172949-Pleurochrysis_carterae.AAC.1
MLAHARARTRSRTPSPAGNSHTHEGARTDARKLPLAPRVTQAPCARHSHSHTHFQTRTHLRACASCHAHRGVRRYTHKRGASRPERDKDAESECGQAKGRHA